MGLSALKGREDKEKNHQNVNDDIHTQHRKLVTDIISKVERGGMLAQSERVNFHSAELSNIHHAYKE